MILYNSNNIINVGFNTVKKNKIIVSLASVPGRFNKDRFNKTIKSINCQTLKPDYIVINLCEKYKRKFPCDINFENINNHDNIIYNICKTDYGPITKILGLIELSNNFDDDDLVIIIDDDIQYINNLIELYYLNNTTYNTDITMIDQKHFLFNSITNNIFINKYTGYSLYGWMSWSIKFKYVKLLYEYYTDYIDIEKDMWKHDDLFISLFISDSELNTSEISINSVKDFEIIIDPFSLARDDKKNNYRIILEKKFKLKLKYKSSNLIKINKNIMINTKENYIQFKKL